MSDASLYGTMAMAPSDGSVVTSQANFPLFPYTMPPSTIPAPGNPEPAADGETDGPANGSGTSSSRAAKSCCGSSGGGQKSSLQIDIPPGPTPPPSAKDKAEQKAESCCSPQPSYNAHIKESTAGIMSPPGIHFPPSPAMMHHPFEQGVAMGNGLYPFYAQPSIFNYPPQYGSYMQPLQPEQWRQFMAAMTFGQPGACPPFAMAGAVPMQQPPTTPNGSAWTSHHCSCGDSCQCIGCAAHPYNEATKNYVRSAWNTLREDSDKGPPAHANGNGSTLNGPAAIASGSNGSNGEHEEMANGASHGTSTPNTVNPDGTWSPVAAQTPSDAASGISEEQALSASDFFFVSYPFDDACAGQGFIGVGRWFVLRARFAWERKQPALQFALGAEPEPEPAELPYSVRPLVKSDFAAFEPLFAFYLELQKQRYLEDMDEREARGRWKRFVGKWNRNELAEGWYDPEVFCRCAEEYAGREGGASPLASDEDEDEDEDEDGPGGSGSDDGSDDEDDHGGGDDYGPRLPARDPARRVGVKQPTRRDLAARDELLQEQREADGEAARQARRAERRLQKERLDELVPAAQPGTRERRLEKKKEAGESMRQFRERSPGVEVGDGELMGGGDTAEEYRRMKQREHRRKSDRQVRREEFERAKGEEMELRRRAWQRREEGTVSMLRELAKQRFGQGP
ncbi:hypothetical protein UVI_02028020 [Ustilaginoidea virens]|uniref:Uncharacterized protein n=1 Tax=Ustilaginoidea virens TaxID=1159556 RepID=A0A1B5KVD8_USTVR|nr:hypothetical protein UVI_02028020 [Ustilaginoidea virens]